MTEIILPYEMISYVCSFLPEEKLMEIIYDKKTGNQMLNIVRDLIKQKIKKVFPNILGFPIINQMSIRQMANLNYYILDIKDVCEEDMLEISKYHFLGRIVENELNSNNKILVEFLYLIEPILINNICIRLYFSRNLFENENYTICKERPANINIELLIEWISNTTPNNLLTHSDISILNNNISIILNNNIQYHQPPLRNSEIDIILSEKMTYREYVLKTILKYAMTGLTNNPNLFNSCYRTDSFIILFCNIEVVKILVPKYFPVNTKIDGESLPEIFTRICDQSLVPYLTNFYIESLRSIIGYLLSQGADDSMITEEYANFDEDDGEHFSGKINGYYIENRMRRMYYSLVNGLGLVSNNI